MLPVLDKKNHVHEATHYIFMSTGFRELMKLAVPCAVILSNGNIIHQKDIQ